MKTVYFTTQVLKRWIDKTENVIIEPSGCELKDGRKGYLFEAGQKKMIDSAGVEYEEIDYSDVIINTEIILD